jgi:outer membrane protein assembly factor BamB
MRQTVKNVRLSLTGLLLALAVTVAGCSGEKSESVTKNIPEWKFKTEGRISSSPTLYEDAIYFGSDDGNLYSVDQLTGSLNWKFDTKAHVRSTAAIANDIVYFLSHNGTFYALDAATGERKWSFDTGTAIAENDEWDYFDSSPEISDDVVYFGSSDDRLYALDAGSGAKLWSFEAEYGIKSSPTSDDDSVYFGDWGGYVYAVDKQSGQANWTIKTDGSGYHVAIQAKPVVSGDVLYVAARDFKLYALNASSGEVVWKEPKPAWVASPTLLDGTIYVGNSDGDFMEAVDAKSGQRKWVYDTASNVFSAPAISNGVLYFGSGDAYRTGTSEAFLYAVDLTTGKELSKRKTEKIMTTPLIDSGSVFYTSFDGYLHSVKIAQ